MSTLFGGIRQLGTVVHDADAAMAAWAKVGVGPFFLMSFRMEDYSYRGQPCAGPAVKLCFAHSGPLQVEIIQQLDDTPSGYREFLDAGLEGAQHICGWYSDHSSYDAARRRIMGTGLGIVHEGGLRLADARFCYFETGIPGSMMMEISEATLGANGEAIPRMEEAARNWDGRQIIADHMDLL